MAKPVAELIGKQIGNRPIIGLSDRFLGSYDYLQTVKRIHGEKYLPNHFSAFNGVPIMAQKARRDDPVSVFYIKPQHSVACYPANQKDEAISLMQDVFSLKPQELTFYDSLLHMAFENTHCIEHAVADLENLKTHKYQAGGSLYSSNLYTNTITQRISAIVHDRDTISQAVLGRRFASLSDYDKRVFGASGAPEETLAGHANFRIHHNALSKAPNPEAWGAFGYEDIGWSLVTLESFGKYYGIHTPDLSKLIEEWSHFTGQDYRVCGRTLTSLGLINELTPYFNNDIDIAKLNWLPNILPHDNSPTLMIDQPQLSQGATYE